MDIKRVLLKLSGEALSNNGMGSGYNEDKVRDVARQVKLSVDKGIEIGIVIGGGN